MARHLWAKVRVDMRHHPKIVGRPDGDFRLWASLILHAKEHCPDGVVRGLSPGDMRGSWGIKAPVKKVKHALAYFEKEEMLIRQSDGGLLITDFVEEQRSLKDSPEAVAERMRGYRKRKKAGVTGPVTAGVTGERTGDTTRDGSVTRYAEGEGDQDQEISKRSGEEIPIADRGEARAAGPPSSGWAPVLLRQLREALGKNEGDPDWLQFLRSAMKYSREQREAAGEVFLERCYADSGKGVSYLLAMMRDGAGLKRNGTGSNRASREQDAGARVVPGREESDRWRQEQRELGERVEKDRLERKRKGLPSAAQEALAKARKQSPNGAPKA